MRITNKLMTSNYMNNLNASLEALTKSNEKITTGRSYLKASEDPATALKAFQVRQSLSRISLYENNIKDVESILAEVETAVSGVNDILMDAMEQVIKGKSDTYSAEDRQSIATVIRQNQDQILNIANSKYGNKFIFGGSDMKKIPFALAAGELTYHTKNVNDNDFAGITEEMFCDIGLGLTTDASGHVIAGTALDVANPGSQMFGTGIDGDGMPNNIYNLLGNIAEMFENNDLTNVDKYMNKLEEKTENNMLNYVNIGQRCNFIDFLKGRFETDKFNATAKQSDLEGIDEAKAIIDFNVQEMAYQAALNMGGKIIQTSLLDYLR